MTNLVRQEKRDTWERLKRQHPEFADDIVKINRVFGKPESILVQGEKGQWLRVK